jgi:hypothetical protein
MEARYQIISLLLRVHRFATVVRGHWSIEDILNWQSDVTLGEDESRMCRARARPGSVYFGGLHRVCSNARPVGKRASRSGGRCVARDEYRDGVLLTC